MTVLNITEVFGPVIQGEGLLIGKPAVFIRAHGCDYACNGCDTPYARRPFNLALNSADELVEMVVERTKGIPLSVVLTGGNPALQDFSELIMLLMGRGYTTAIETQGSIACNWFSELDYLTISPKAPSSGNITEISSVSECIKKFEDGFRQRSRYACIKVVVQSKLDLYYAEEIFGAIDTNFPGHSMLFCLQPFNASQNPNREVLIRAYDRLVSEVLKRRMYSVSILPQLHVIVWGNERGR